MMRRVAFLLGLLLLAALGPAAAAQEQDASNLVSGSGSATNTAATQIIAAPSSTRRIYVTGVQCARNDAGTSAVFVTLNDTSSTVIVLPNSGGGGGSNMVFASPLTVASATALTFTASGSISTIYCNAQGFTGN
jgi:hypothetical protein